MAWFRKIIHDLRYKKPKQEEVKFPAGVFNLVNGDGATTGNALTSHPDINMISFTGSTRAGALISQNAAKDFKRVR